MLKDILKKKFKIKNKGFTLAEVLVTLTIIGIVAAILFPSILANYTERTLNAKRQALIARMSQAMAELGETFPNYEDADKPEENSALKFINEGLSKAYKITAACDYATLTSCDIPETVTRVDGSQFELIKNAENISTYSPSSVAAASWEATGWVYDTQSAGFMTKNGESILVFFNPRCKTKQYGVAYNNSVNYVTTICVNMVYDLNGGKQKPNRINEDIGFMSVYYSNSPTVVAPKIVTPTDFIPISGTGTTLEVMGFNKVNYETAKTNCALLGDNIKLPSYEEMGSIAMNHVLYSDIEEFKNSNNWYWTSTAYTTTNNKVLGLNYTATGNPGEGGTNTGTATTKYNYTCVYDN